MLQALGISAASETVYADGEHRALPLGMVVTAARGAPPRPGLRGAGRGELRAPDHRGPAVRRPERHHQHAALVEALQWLFERAFESAVPAFSDPGKTDGGMDRTEHLVRSGRRVP